MSVTTEIAKPPPVVAVKPPLPGVVLALPGSSTAYDSSASPIQQPAFGVASSSLVTRRLDNAAQPLKPHGVVLAKDPPGGGSSSSSLDARNPVHSVSLVAPPSSSSLKPHHVVPTLAAPVMPLVAPPSAVVIAQPDPALPDPAPPPPPAIVDPSKSLSRDASCEIVYEDPVEVQGSMPSLPPTSDVVLSQIDLETLMVRSMRRK